MRNARDTDIINEELRDRAEAIVNRLVRREHWAGVYAQDILSRVLTAYADAAAAGEVRNFEGFVTTVARRRLIDISRHVKVDAARLGLAAATMRVPRVVNGDFVEELRRDEPFVGLSFDYIAREEEALQNLMAAAACAVLPDPEDRRLARDRAFDQSEPTLEELGRRHGGVGAQAISNRLARIFGSGARPGAVVPAIIAVRRMRPKVARSFVEVLDRFDSYALVSDPIAAAIHHLEFMGRHSKDHERQALLGVSRLRWIAGHLPGRRSLADKVMHRLVEAACFYVLESNDANPDGSHALGLRDDVQVIDVVQRLLKDHVTKS